LGAKVAGVCSTRNWSSSADRRDEVIDYQAEDFTGGRRFDLLIDIAGSRSASASRRVLTSAGTFVVVEGRWPVATARQPDGLALATGPFVSQRMVAADRSGEPRRSRFRHAGTGIERGQVTRSSTGAISSRSSRRPSDIRRRVTLRGRSSCRSDHDDRPDLECDGTGR
jgi:NADPH:quinone reductase-like Zn-dependent oxidoreductase